MNKEYYVWKIEVSGRGSHIFEYPSTTKPTVNEAAIFVRNEIFKDNVTIVPDQNPSAENKAQIHLRSLGYEIESIWPVEVE